MNVERAMSPATKVRRDHNYAKCINEILHVSVRDLSIKKEQVTTELTKRKKKKEKEKEKLEEFSVN